MNKREKMIKKRKRKKKVWAGLALVLILAGAVLVYLGFQAKLEERSVQKQLRAIYSSQLEERPPVTTQAVPPTEAGGSQPPDPEADPRPSVLPDDDEEAQEPFDIRKLKPMAIVTIPRIKIEAVMVEGVTPNDLRYAVGHFPGTGLPGQPGNLSIAGHRNFITGDFFGHLDKVVPGDEILVEYEGRRFTYRVTESFAVLPHETWVLNPTSEAQITLVTCTPPRVSSHRLIVRGVLQEG